MAAVGRAPSRRRRTPPRGSRSEVLTKVAITASPLQDPGWLAWAIRDDQRSADRILVESPDGRRGERVVTDAERQRVAYALLPEVEAVEELVRQLAEQVPVSPPPGGEVHERDDDGRSAERDDRGREGFRPVEIDTGHAG